MIHTRVSNKFASDEVCPRTVHGVRHLRICNFAIHLEKRGVVIKCDLLPRWYMPRTDVHTNPGQIVDTLVINEESEFACTHSKVIAVGQMFVIGFAGASVRFSLDLEKFASFLCNLLG